MLQEWQRITAIETKVSYLEHIVEELNSVVTKLVEESEQRDAKLELLTERYRQLQEGEEELVERQPSHY
jgi:uncharacterized coiled-coil protein SlyX